MSTHFIGFRNDRYISAVKIWGVPDFIHRNWDKRAQGDITAGDTVVFAKGDENTPQNPFAFNDSEWF